VLRDHRDEGELSIRNASGELTVVSRQSRSRLSLPGGGEASAADEVLTDVEDIDDEDLDEEDEEIEIVGDGSAQYFIPETGNSMVSVVEKEKYGPKRYSLTEFLKLPNEDEVHTDIEDLEDDPSNGRKSSLGVYPELRLITPEFVVDPGTDVESLNPSPVRSARRMSAGTQALYDQVMATLAAGGGNHRAISPSDCGEPPLYENITDEEDLLQDTSRRVSSSTSYLLPAGATGGACGGNDDVGGLTDCEDFQASEDELDDEDHEFQSKKSKRKEKDEEEESAFEKAFVASIIASAQTSIIMRESESGVSGTIVEEVPTDDDEIHEEELDKKQLTPRLVLYQQKNLGDSDEEDECNWRLIQKTFPSLLEKSIIATLTALAPRNKSNLSRT
jgi:hypothetical protein